MSKQDSQFKPGQSGNPSGRPKGARNKSTVAAEALLDGESEALTRRCIDLEMEGDPTALRLCLSRILPVKRERRHRTGSTRSGGLSGCFAGSRDNSARRWLRNDHTIGRTGRGVAAGDASADF